MPLKLESPEPVSFWFPGRWISGISMLIAPLLLLLSEILRIEFEFFYPEQLQAFIDHPTRLTASYSLFLAGNILLWPAIVALSNLIGKSQPAWALWGGTFVMLGLFARTFHYGINHLAFQLTKVQNVASATKAVGDSYGAFHIVSTLSAAIMFGWIILAIGAYRSRTLNLVGSIALGLMSILMLGVLKGATFTSIIATSGLCIAFLPLGNKMMRSDSLPTIKTTIQWLFIIVIVIAAMYMFGQAG
ncbi:hypothetical protein [Sphingobacterium shayense]|uniref:hypothetical protein n=1 Tax=Sphingobacterium shayense TaxID=626343 RepID=UPI001C13268E|nr:hypothetical protein [Sphingobacterium shayense]